MARQLDKIIPEDPAITVKGKWKSSFNQFGDIVQILVQPTNINNIYSFGIKDEGGYLIYIRHNIQGPLIDFVEVPVFPGEKTMIIENAQMDDIFNVKMIYRP